MDMVFSQMGYGDAFSCCKTRLRNRLASFLPSFSILGLAGANAVGCRSQAIRGLWVGSRFLLLFQESLESAFQKTRPMLPNDNDGGKTNTAAALNPPLAQESR